MAKVRLDIELKRGFELSYRRANVPQEPPQAGPLHIRRHLAPARLVSDTPQPVLALLRLELYHKSF